MARMHTGKHGRSKSRKPPAEEIKADASRKAEVEELIVKYFKQGLSPAQIGQVLKDKHGVKYVKPIIGMRLNEFLESKGLKRSLPPDLLDLVKKAVNMRDHLAKNHKDVHNKVRLNRVESKIWRLTKYYKRVGKLPKDWAYDPQQAALLIKGG